MINWSLSESREEVNTKKKLRSRKNSKSSGNGRKRMIENEGEGYNMTSWPKGLVSQGAMQ